MFNDFNYFILLIIYNIRLRYKMTSVKLNFEFGIIFKIKTAKIL